MAVISFKAVGFRNVFKSNAMLLFTRLSHKIIPFSLPWRLPFAREIGHLLGAYDGDVLINQ
jgi:hypothetical protein